MPSKSPKQHNLMEMAMHDMAFRKKKGISKKVAKDFVDADKRKGMKGRMKHR